DCAITHNHDRRARFDARRIRGKPTGSQNVGGCEQVWYQVFGRTIACCHQSAVSQRNTQKTGLRGAHELTLNARRLIAVLADDTSVVGSGERADDELAALDLPDLSSDLFHDAAVFVTHGSWLRYFSDAAIGPQVRSANTRGREADDGVCRFDDFRVRPILGPNIARSVQHGSSHLSSPSFRACNPIRFFAGVTTGSHHRHSAIDSEGVTDYVARRGTAKPEYRRRDFRGSARTADGKVLRDLGVGLLVPADHIAGDLGVDQARIDGVHADAVPDVFQSGGSRQSDDAVLRGNVRADTGVAGQRADGAVVDDRTAPLAFHLPQFI